MKKRYGMSIDIDKCTGCGACMIACAVENNIPPAHEGATERKGITWIRVIRVDNGEEYPDRRSAFIPVLCQQCGEHPPCASVCPQQAVEVDPRTGIVGQMPERCLGCRYCMAACPYHARFFNWWDPAWPAGMEKTLNPNVAPRMRGVVEKCNFCHGRWHAAKERAAAAGKKDIDPADYVPACVEACPSGAIRFGDLDDRQSEVAQLAARPGSFRLLEKLHTDPKIYYHSKREWVRAKGEPPGAVRGKRGGGAVARSAGVPVAAGGAAVARSAGVPVTAGGAAVARSAGMPVAAGGAAVARSAGVPVAVGSGKPPAATAARSTGTPARTSSQEAPRG